MLIAFAIPGDPRGKGRPRATVRGSFARVYTDAKTRAYESGVKAAAVAAMAGREPMAGPLSVVLRIRLPLPASMPKRRRAAVLAGEDAYFGRIDCDNAAKAVLDGCNGVCWADDVQITRLFVAKVPHERPGVDVRIEQLGVPGESRQDVVG